MMSSLTSNYGIVEYFGSNSSGYPCGYCKTTKPDSSDYGMWAHKITPYNYQCLIDRGWRRSGKYCYKPILNRTCCPAYTIRCDASAFKLSKSQKKVLKRMNRFLEDDEKRKCFDRRGENEMQMQMMVENNVSGDVSISKEKIMVKDVTSFKKVTHSQGDQEGSSGIVNKTEDEPNHIVEDKVNKVNKDNKDQALPLDCASHSMQKKMKSKLFRKERKLRKIMEREKCTEEDGKLIMAEEMKRKNKMRSLESYIDESMESHKLGKEKKHKLQIRYVSTSEDDHEETFNLSHSLYRKYQINIHKDKESDCAPKQFRRFLTDTPIQAEMIDPSSSDNSSSDNDDSLSLPYKLGSYHMQYWLDDDKLIAVGVIDVLPSSVSSVYLYYDPDYEFLSLGTYSALRLVCLLLFYKLLHHSFIYFLLFPFRELYLVRKLQDLLPGFKYYYMGFYIHSCSKMRYKGKYTPSYLLCPEVFNWHPIEDCLPKLDKQKYCRFEAENSTLKDEDGFDVADHQIMILNNRNVKTFAEYKLDISRYNNRIDIENDKNVKEFGKLVGKKCASQLLLYKA
ncbi:unnamed protein product [Sphagnum balticum]